MAKEKFLEENMSPEPMDRLKYQKKRMVIVWTENCQQNKLVNERDEDSSVGQNKGVLLDQETA